MKSSLKAKHKPLIKTVHLNSTQHIMNTKILEDTTLVKQYECKPHEQKICKNEKSFQEILKEWHLYSDFT